MGNGTETIRSYRDLLVWQRAMDLVTSVYELTSKFPDQEKFGLVSQLRRAAVSIPSNVAEGYGRGRPQEYLRFLKISRGSLCEVETQLLLSQRLGYVNQQKGGSLQEQIDAVAKVLSGLIGSMERRVAGS